MFLVVSSFASLVFRDVYVVSDNHNFVAQQSPGNGYGCQAYGKLSHFVYCILQKIKKSGSLPLEERWEKYMLPNHSSFTAIEEEHFLVGTRVHSALEEMSNSYLKKESQSNTCFFLEEFCSSILSTVAASSKLGQGVSCFCPEMLLGGDEHSTVLLNGQLLDGVVEYGWEKCPHSEAFQAEF